MAKVATKAKSASISRSGNSYTFKWTNGSYWSRSYAALNTSDESWKWGQVSTSTTSKVLNVTRGNYYPRTSKKLLCVKGHVRGYHSSKTKGYSPAAEPAFTFTRPAAPTIGGVSYSEGVLSMSWEIPDSATSTAERKDLVVTVTRVTNLRSETDEGTVKTTTVYTNHVVSTATGEADGTYSVSEGAVLAHADEYIRYSFAFKCRGMAGDSDVRTVSYAIEYADAPVLKSVHADLVSGVVAASFEQHGAAARRSVGSSRLQYQACDGYPEGSWSDIDDAVTEKDGATGINCSTSQITRGTNDLNVWFRVVNYWMSEATVSVSDPIECEEMRLSAADPSTPATSVLAIEAIEPVGTNGAKVTIGWANDANVGTTISWSTDPEAWESTAEPTTYTMADARYRVDGEEHANKAVVKVANLEENTLYYFRARRYASTTSYGGWTALGDGAKCVTGTTAGVTMSCPAAIGVGEDLAVSWSVGGSKEQTAWRVEVNGTTMADGIGTATAAVIPGSALEAGSSDVSVWATTGGGWVQSNVVTVGIYQRPSVTVSASTITARPATATISCDMQGVTADVALVACGVVATLPDGTDATQYEGEVVWRSSVPLVASGEAATASVSVPEGVRLVDGAQYVWEAVPCANGLYGEKATSGRVAVAWAHQAAAPTCTMALDADGLSVTVTPVAPAGAAQTDVCDVYRATENGIYAIAEGVPFGSSVTDRFAAFQHVSDEDARAGYVLCTRTADGDVAWAEQDSGLVADELVIDWAGSQVRLPYDIELDADWTKRVETQTYLDGTSRAWYLDGRDMATKYATTLARIGDAEQKSLLSELAAWPGTAYVRDPFGHAFEATVDVSGRWSASSALVTYAIGATEVSLSGYLAEEVENG